MDGVDLGLGPAPMAPDLPEPSQVNPSKTSQLIKLALMGLAGGLGPGAGTGIMQGLYRSEQERQQQAQLTDRQNMQRFQYQQQQYQQQARDYEQQQALKQKAVADAFAQLGKDAPNFTTRAEFEQRATLYSQQLQMMGIRVPPQALMQQVPYLEPSERDVIAEAINKNQKQFPDAWDGGAPLAAHIQYRDPKTGETRDIQIGKALEAGLVSLPVDPATGKWIGSEAKKPERETRSLQVQAADALARGDMETYNRLLQVDRQFAASGRQAPDPALAEIRDLNKQLLQRQLESNLTPQQAANARGLADDFYRESKDFVTLSQSYRTIRTVGRAAPSGPGDISLIFAYMKMLDPGSTVREGEQATAKNAVAVPDWVRNLYNNTMKGTALTPTQRADFVNRAKQIYDGAKRLQDATVRTYTDRARVMQVDPTLVIRDYSEGVETDATTDPVGQSALDKINRRSGGK